MEVSLHNLKLHITLCKSSSNCLPSVLPCCCIFIVVFMLTQRISILGAKQCSARKAIISKTYLLSILHDIYFHIYKKFFGEVVSRAHLLIHVSLQNTYNNWHFWYFCELYKYSQTLPHSEVTLLGTQVKPWRQCYFLLREYVIGFHDRQGPYQKDILTAKGAPLFHLQEGLY